MKFLPCPHLGDSIELTEERQGHILSKHPDFLPEYFEQLAETNIDTAGTLSLSQLAQAALCVWGVSLSIFFRLLIFSLVICILTVPPSANTARTRVLSSMFFAFPDSSLAIAG